MGTGILYPSTFKLQDEGLRLRGRYELKEKGNEWKSE